MVISVHAVVRKVVMVDLLKLPAGSVLKLLQHLMSLPVLVKVANG